MGTGGALLLRGSEPGSIVTVLTTTDPVTSRIFEPGAKFTTIAGRRYLDQVEMMDGTVREVIVRAVR